MQIAAGSTHRVQLQPAYVLHQKPYRDSGAIVELFTRDYGRLTVFARGLRGGKKQGNALASVLQPFQRVLVSYGGRGDAGHLNAAEFDGSFCVLPAARTLSGFYLNELLIRLFERHDPHLDAFDLYDAVVTRLKDATTDEQSLLRLFEKRLLELLGYGLQLNVEAQSDRAVQAHCVYRYIPEYGVRRIDGVADGANIYSGASLLGISGEDFQSPSVRADARRLLRAALEQYLSGRGLRTREVLGSLRRMR